MENLILAWTLQGIVFKAVLFVFNLFIAYIVAKVIVHKTRLPDWPWIYVMTFLSWLIIIPLFWLAFKLVVVLLVVGLVIAFIVAGGNIQNFKRILAEASDEIVALKRKSG
jgi:hypothetical protein